MTCTKIEKQRQDLIAEYGDVGLIEYYNKKGTILGLRLSQVPINNTADLTEVKRVLKSKQTRRIRVSDEIDVPRPPSDK